MTRFPKWMVWYLALPALGIAVFAGGYLFHGWLAPKPAPAAGDGGGPANSQPKVQQWTCSMHPQIKLPKPGKCPICGMALIPLKTGTGDEGERTLAVSPASMKLMEIQTSVVRRCFVNAQVRLFGKVEYDETRLAYITAWVGGRIDRLYVDYTGVSVRKGDHLVYLYSPELLSAQEELLQAIIALKDIEKSETKRRLPWRVSRRLEVHLASLLLALLHLTF